MKKVCFHFPPLFFRIWTKEKIYDARVGTGKAKDADNVSISQSMAFELYGSLIDT